MTPGLSDALQTLITRWREQGNKFCPVLRRGDLPARGFTTQEYQERLVGVVMLQHADELAAICTRVTASPTPEALPCTSVTYHDPVEYGVMPSQHPKMSQVLDALADAELPVCPEHVDAEFVCPHCYREHLVQVIHRAIDEKLLVYGDGLIDKGALYREVLNDERDGQE